MAPGVRGDSGGRWRVRRRGIRALPEADSEDLTALQEAHQALVRQRQDAERVALAVRAVLRRENGPLAVVRAAQGIANAALVALFQPDGHGDLVCVSSIPDSLLGMRLPIGGTSLVAGCHDSGQPAWVDDWASDQRIESERAATEQAVGDVRLRQGVGYPITNDGRRLGVLLLACPETAPDVRGNSAMLDLLATETALALAHEALLLELERLSGSDPLTGAANRRAWELTLARELPRAVREGHPICLLMIDLDHFKRYNDVHGHTAGDRVLRTVAESWQSRLRPGDLLCRWGGEEFAVLLPNCTVWGARVVAEALRALMPAGITCSVGVAEWDHEESDHQLIARADSYLYGAKAAGRNCVSTTRGSR